MSISIKGKYKYFYKLNWDVSQNYLTSVYDVAALCQKTLPKYNNFHQFLLRLPDANKFEFTFYHKCL